MNVIEITTKKRALELLRAAVKIKGADYVDPPTQQGDPCWYANSSGPSCLIGYALHLAGVSVETLRGLDRLSWPGIAGPSAPYDQIEDRWSVAYLAARGVAIAESAQRVLAAAQRMQDEGKSWGQALREAKRVRVSG